MPWRAADLFATRWTPEALALAHLIIVGFILYKIVPFLIWLHLQNQGQGRVMAPNMRKIIAEQAMKRKMLAYYDSCALLLLAVFWPEWFVYPAGLALILAHGGLLRNLLAAMGVYRAQQQKIAAVTAAQSSQAHP